MPETYNEYKQVVLQECKGAIRPAEKDYVANRYKDVIRSGFANGRIPGNVANTIEELQCAAWDEFHQTAMELSTK